MRTFVTGATGFIGGRLARALAQRGDQVVALVRSPDRAAGLRDLGCELVPGDLADEAAIRSGVEGCDALFHSAAVYKVGIPESERRAMYEANVRGTERVLDAAIAAGVSRIVYVSTVGVFGNTKGRVVDESYRRDLSEGFLSCYDESKFAAHDAALERIRAGAPIVIVQPGGVYGPGDTSEIANMIGQVRKGRMKMLIFPEVGFNLVHVDDVVQGILLAHDKGRIGESYVLGGEVTTMGEAVQVVAELDGRKPPTRTVPPALVKLAIPFGGLVSKVMGTPPNLREGIKAVEGVTYWASHAKAQEELGYSARDLRTGMAETLAASPR
ncbi:MAG: NAD-dependent epimerase/dehydratase family protein [Actinomycetota bacterium]|nr:NAD-dependent epimerase/dehydratase family protein [Actinomycetota bacterium]